MIHMPVPINETLDYTRSVLPSMDNVDIVVTSKTNAGLQNSQVVSMPRVYFLSIICTRVIIVSGLGGSSMAQAAQYTL